VRQKYEEVVITGSQYKLRVEACPDPGAWLLGFIGDSGEPIHPDLDGFRLDEPALQSLNDGNDIVHPICGGTLVIWRSRRHLVFKAVTDAPVPDLGLEGRMASVTWRTFATTLERIERARSCEAG
jgi:hypothetical protein